MIIKRAAGVGAGAGAAEAAIDHQLVPDDEFSALSIEIARPVKPKYPAKEHARKVAKELGVEKGLVYLPGKLEETWEDSDMGPAFRQRRYFYYLSGADFAGCAVTYDVGADELVLWIPYTPPQAVLWFGKTPSPDECRARADLDDVRYVQGLPAYLAPALDRAGTLYVLHAAQLPPGLVAAADEEGEGRHRPASTWTTSARVDATALRPAMDEARVVKTAYEIAMIRRANDVSSAAHRAVCRRMRSYTNECEIEATFVGACVAENAHSQAYAVIAGSGPNAATLHYGANNEPLKGRQLVVVDAGAEWQCYASDVTRTLPIGGAFTREARAVYDVVQRMQSECVARVAPGAVFYHLHVHAHRVAVAGLLRLGILRGGTEAEILAAGTSAAFFPHGLGHHVGLEVHDVTGRERLMLSANRHPGAARPAPQIHGQKRHLVGPKEVRLMVRYAAGNADALPPPPPAASSASSFSSGVGAGAGGGRRRLAPGMVVTIEPGIYFCRDFVEAYFLSKPEHARYIDTEVLDRYWDVGGVRIEDCILVTEDGHENLTTAPKADEMLRLINGKA